MIHPAIIPGRVRGKIILVNVLNAPAPRSRAASTFYLLKIFIRRGILMTSAKWGSVI